jgi:hypothetical protein
LLENLTVERKLYNGMGKFKPEKVGNFTPEMTISKNFIVDVNHMKGIIFRSFHKFSSRMSFAKRWIEKFLNNKLEMFGS